MLRAYATKPIESEGVFHENTGGADLRHRHSDRSRFGSNAPHFAGQRFPDHLRNQRFAIDLVDAAADSFLGFIGKSQYTGTKPCPDTPKNLRHFQAKWSPHGQPRPRVGWR